MLETKKLFSKKGFSTSSLNKFSNNISIIEYLHCGCHIEKTSLYPRWWNMVLAHLFVKDLNQETSKGLLLVFE